MPEYGSDITMKILSALKLCLFDMVQYSLKKKHRNNYSMKSYI